MRLGEFLISEHAEPKRPLQPMRAGSINVSDEKCIVFFYRLSNITTEVKVYNNKNTLNK